MRKVLVGVAAAIAVVGLGSGTAMAVPPGLEKQVDKKSEAWVCDGEDVTLFIAGRNGYIGDTHYHAVSFTFNGTFTPSDGSEPQSVSESKSWGGGESGPGEIHCTMHVEEQEEDGTVVFDATVTAFPVR